MACGRACLDEIQHGVLEGVVHHGVQSAPEQISSALAEAFLRGRILPHFAQQQLFVAVRLDGGADLFNEIVGQLIGYIQPEARRAPPFSQVSMTPPLPQIKST